MKKVKVRVTIKGDTDVGVLTPDECQQYFDKGMTGEMAGLSVGSVEQLKSELEILEESGGGFEGKEIPEVTFMPRVTGG